MDGEALEKRRAYLRRKVTEYRAKEPEKFRIRGRIDHYRQAGLDMDEAKKVANKGGSKIQPGAMSLKSPHGVMYSIYRGWQDCSLDEIVEAAEDRKGKLEAAKVQ